MKKIVICTLCPNGCEISAEYEANKNVKITGNRCDKGNQYALSECFNPQRTFTSNVAVKGSYRKNIPVRSNKPIPKDRMLSCAEMLRKIHYEAPVSAGTVVVKNIYDSGADIVTTINVEREE